MYRFLLYVHARRFVLDALVVRGMFFNSCHLLDYFSRGLTARKLFVCGRESCLYVVKAQSFLIRMVSKLLLSDARAYSNRILKQCIVMTLRYFPINLQYVISITSIENAITFRNTKYRSTSILQINLLFM